MKWFSPRSKVSVQLEIDADVLKWYKTKGGKFQSTMVSILKKYMQAHL